MNNKSTRHNEILEILKISNYATVESLAKELHISPSSIRRDLSAMVASGSVIRSHGGVSLAISENLNVSFSIRMKSNQDKKRKIAEKAIELIKDGDVVFVDASSTSMYLLKKLASKNGLTVITNGIPALQYLSNFKIKVLCTGGSLDTEDRAALVGIEAIKTLQNIRANIAFISPQAIDEAGNLFDCYPDEVEVTRQMIESSMTTVALCDSTKIGKSSTFKQCSIKNLDFLVSDISLDTVYGNMFPNTKFL